MNMYFMRIKVQCLLVCKAIAICYDSDYVTGVHRVRCIEPLEFVIKAPENCQEAKLAGFGCCP